jgi:hypothetical protein
MYYMQYLLCLYVGFGSCCEKPSWVSITAHFPRKGVLLANISSSIYLLETRSGPYIYSLISLF